jgi:hypothetical protein
MPNIISAQDVIGKTLYPKKKVNFWKGSQLRSGDLLDKDKAGTLPVNYPFLVYSFAAPSSVRRNLYWMAKDSNGQIILVRHVKGDFDFKKLAAQGVKTEQQKIEEEEEKEKTLADRIADTLKDAGKFAKWVIIAGLGIYAIGYLAPKLKK